MMSLRDAGLLSLGAGSLLAGGLALLNRTLLLDDLPPTLPGAPLDWTWQGWRVRYTTLGDGPPLVLVHGVHAAASSFEMDKIFQPLATKHTVYALDLLGFGKSERPNIPYTGALYADLVADFLAQVVKAPAIVIGSSLGAAYAVATAARHPDLVRGLVLFSPTGQTGIGLGGRAFAALLGLRLIGTAAFNLLVSRSSIRHYLEQVYANPALVDDALLDQQWAVSHQPNARFAPAAFIAGALDLPFPGSEARIRTPILVIRGDEPGLGPETPDAVLERLGGAVTSRRLVNVGQLPHQEEPENVLGLIDGWEHRLDDVIK
jgi:pimeloyl-ACP methyl ester carboxylesterase